jgi:hypothetical protein
MIEMIDFIVTKITVISNVDTRGFNATSNENILEQVLLNRHQTS